MQRDAPNGSRSALQCLTDAAAWSTLLFVAGVQAYAEESVGTEVYGPEEGLSQLTVTAMVEDDQGFLWVGTQEGLNRFDGHRFKVHRRHPDGSGLLSSSIDALAFDSQQQLWLGTNDAGLEVIHLPTWRSTRLTEAQGLSHRRVHGILEDAEGGAWVLTDAGVDRVDSDLKRASLVSALDAGVALTWSDAVARPLVLDDSCHLFEVREDHLATVLDGLGEGVRCTAMQSAPEGVWLASAEHGIFRIAVDGTRLDQVDVPPASGRGSLTTLGRTAAGDLLLGWEFGAVTRVSPVRGGDQVTWRMQPAAESAITVIHEHSSGTLWLGSYTGGLRRVRPLSAALRGQELFPQDLLPWPNRSVRAIWTDGAEVRIGTDAGMVQHRSSGDWVEVPGFAGRSVRVLRRARFGGWWVGTQDGLYFESAAGVIDRIEGMPDPRIDDILIQGEDVWVSTRAGLARVDSDTRRAASFAMQGIFTTTLLADGHGGLWVGTNDRGLWRVAADGSAVRFEPEGAGALHESVWSLHADGPWLWVGTFSGGLYRIDSESLQTRRYTDREGLSNNVIYRILEDDFGRLWMSTNSGLSVLDPDLDIVQTLGRRDGLRNQEFNSGAAFRDAAGLLHFGGTRGIDVVDPRQLARRSPPAHPVLTDLRVVGRQRDPGRVEDDRWAGIVYSERLDFDYRDSVISIGMTAIDFTAPGAARLRYRLDGLHQDWVHPNAPQAEASFSFLPPGSYRLEVAAAGRDGRFGEPRSLVLHMPAPPWRQPLAYVGYLLVVLVLLAWLVSRIGSAVRQERAQVARLNRIVTERTEQLENANRLLQQSNDQLEVATRRDPLTQVSNRRDLQDWLARECAQVREEIESGSGSTSSTLIFFMIDIDDFKRINDDYGHRIGDQALVAVADHLRHICRGRDIVVRWGGEEFMLVARGTRVSDAARLAERIRSTIAADPVLSTGGRRLELTVSIGFAPWPFVETWPALGDWEQTVHLADRCLYAAKASGKNAWVGMLPGDAPDRPAVHALLSDGDPWALGERCVRVAHSTLEAPRFVR